MFGDNRKTDNNLANLNPTSWGPLATRKNREEDDLNSVHHVPSEKFTMMQL